MIGTMQLRSFGSRGILLSWLMCPLLGGMYATEASADTRLDFKFSNRLGVTIKEVYMSPHHSDKWEEDILGQKVMPDGVEIPVRFNPSDVDRADIWDMKIVTSEGRIFYWQSPGFNLTKIRKITLYMKGNEAVAEQEAAR